MYSKKSLVMLEKLSSYLTIATIVVTSAFVQSTEAATIEFFDADDFLNSAGNLTTIGFDDLPTGNGVLSGNEFIAQGLTIVQRDSLPINVLSGGDIDRGFPGNVNSEPNVISSSFILGGFNNANSDNFDFFLTNPSLSAGLWIGNTGSSGDNTTEIQFLDSFGQVIASEIISFNTPGLITGSNGIFDNRIFYGITTTIDISTIRTIEPALDSDGITYDDIQFSNNQEIVPVPEPHSTLITSIALGLGALFTRKQRAKV